MIELLKQTIHRFIETLPFSLVGSRGRTRPHGRYLLPVALTVSVFISACSSDVRDPVADNDNQDQGSGNVSNPGAANNGLFGLSVSNDTIGVIEGESVTIQLQVNRSNGHNLPINLAASGQTQSDVRDVYWTFSDTQLTGSEDSTALTVGVNIAALPIQRQQRSLRIIGTDGNNAAIVVDITLDIEPTPRPDVYLLVGQSNMVGFSEDNAKEAFAGGLDASNDRIFQLNVTGNDGQNFDSAAAFTDVSKIAVASPRFTLAVDPLHDGFDARINGKEGARVGLGLTFAKRAINDTVADIYLVPAAWSNTGFCQRDRGEFQGSLGWNASNTGNSALSGTLLHDRAIARANLTLQETGGILRGILWHQGEADSDNDTCASLYEQNIRNLVASFRSNIVQDARGANGRGANANVPFVVGTMSRGGVYSFQSEPKQIVDGVHRNIRNVVPFSAFVNADDLVPPAYPCGEGDCIHFGARSYREMGSRYYDFLRQAAGQ